MTVNTDDLESMLRRAMPGDRGRLRGRIRGVERRRMPDARKRDVLDVIRKDIEQSIQRRNRRRAAAPRPEFPEELPITSHVDEIAGLLQKHQVIIVCGETGSGKSTQLPKICLKAGRGVAGVIGHTQPRRLAARSVAARIADELKTPIGKGVGFKIRFTDQVSPLTHVKVMTDGVLLAETQHDRQLRQYDTIIIDEAHERSLNIDFLLGYIKQLLPKRKDLRVIITSATIDPQRFSDHFSGAPIVEVSGRTYPVEMRYRPLQTEDPDEDDRTQIEAIIHAADELALIDAGDILVFLSGEREIRETAAAMSEHRFPGHTPTEVLPLYARLSAAEQNRVFASHPGRRIVLATNVAETSITVPGIRYVIDPGMARISRYSARTKVQHLPIEAVSQASANQRAGRCGRVAEGICIRLYSEMDFSGREPFTSPEIHRSHLASVILQMKSLRLGEPEAFPFVDPPPTRMIRDGHLTLHELGAIDEENGLTDIGRKLSQLPVDPRIGRMILAAHDENALNEVLTIAAVLETQDPRERPLDKQNEADQAHAQFRHESSDFLSLLNIWRFYREQAGKLSGSKLRKACRQNFLSFIRMREWVDTRRQLADFVDEAGLKFNDSPADEARIHRSLLAGLLGNIGWLKDGGVEYVGARDVKFFLNPGSTLFKRKPKWVMAAELAQTTKLYARTVAPIDPGWVEAMATHVVKRNHTEPHWHAKSGHVCAFEKVLLYGLPIVERRRVHFGPIDPTAARQIFIREALVLGDVAERVKFLEHNREQIEAVRELEAKRRKQDVLVDEHTIYSFYDRRVPADVNNWPDFEQWQKTAERKQPRLLYMKPQDLQLHGAGDVTQEQYPGTLQVVGLELPLTYHLEPGHREDGVTLTVPLEALNQIHETDIERLVPGMLREKLIALIKTLPKPIRRLYVPTPDVVDQILPDVNRMAGPLLDALNGALQFVVGSTIRHEDWQPGELVDHLRMNVRVLDEHGKTCAMSRDLAGIKTRLAGRAARSLSNLAEADFNRDGMTRWTFGDVAEQIHVDRGGVGLTAFPAIVDQQKAVGLRVFDTREAAAEAHAGGLKRLFHLELRSDVRFHVEQLANLEKMKLHYAAIGSTAQLIDDIGLASIELIMLASGSDIRTHMEFQERLHAGWHHLGVAAVRLADTVAKTLAAHHALQLRLDDKFPANWSYAAQDMKQQVAFMVYPGFIGVTPWRWLQQMPRYLAGVTKRLDKLAGGGVQRDQKQATVIVPMWNQFVARLNDHRSRRVLDPNLTTYRWWIEEMRVAMFAQELRTSLPVSEKKMAEQWALVRR